MLIGPLFLCIGRQNVNIIDQINGHLLKSVLFFELFDLGKLAIDIRVIFQSLLEFIESLMTAAEVVVTHQVNHHVKHCYNVVLSAGSEKLHVVNACEQKITLKHLHSLISFDMCVSLFFILKLVYKAEINDSNIKLRGIENFFVLIAYHNILGLHIVVGPSSFVYYLHDAN